MIEIRQALESDSETLTNLGRSTFIETFAKDNTKEDMDLYLAATFGVSKQLSEIRDPNRRIDIAWIENRAVGFLHLLKGEPDPVVKGPQPIELLLLYVDSKWHGKGIGPALMEHALLLAKEEKCQTLWLGVWEHNIRAQKFYLKYGFQTVGTHLFRVGTDDQLDLIMSRSV